MAASSVVVLQPGRKGGGSIGVAGEDLPVGPLGLQGAVEAFYLAVLPRAVGPDEDMAGAEVDKLFNNKVDVIIGAAASGVSVSVIDKITGAGVVQFSPANTAAGFDDYDDNGSRTDSTPKPSTRTDETEAPPHG